MSDAIKNTHPALPVERPPAEHGSGQKQQWRLVFEKAWLAAAGDNKTDNSASHTGKGGVVVDTARNGGSVDLLRRVEAVSINGSVPGSVKDMVVYPGACADFTAELESGRFEEFMAKLLGGSGFIFTPGIKDSGVKTLFITREVTQAFEYKGVFRDKSLLLLPSAEGLQLIIRDGGMTAELLSRIVLKLRDIFNDKGIRLARVIVNGTELWQEKEPTVEAASTDLEETLGLINKIY
jgi:hypothetical protein